MVEKGMAWRPMGVLEQGMNQEAQPVNGDSGERTDELHREKTTEVQGEKSAKAGTPFHSCSCT